MCIRDSTGPKWLSGPERDWPPARPIPKEVKTVDINSIATFSPLHLVSINATMAMPDIGDTEEKIGDWRLSLAQKRDT